MQAWPVACSEPTPMWGKNNNLGLKPAAVEPAIAIAPLERVHTPAQPARVTAFIGKTTRLKGEIYSEEELYLDGDVEGSLEVRNLLTIGPNGKVKAKQVLPAAIIAGVLLEGAKYIYIACLPTLDFQEVYGPFSVSVTLMFWAFISGLLLLGGAHLSAAERENGVEEHS